MLDSIGMNKNNRYRTLLNNLRTLKVCKLFLYIYQKCSLSKKEEIKNCTFTAKKFDEWYNMCHNIGE